MVWSIDPVQIPPPETDTPPVVSQEIDLIGSHQGQRRWRLLADQAQFRGQQQVFDQGAHGFFYGSTETSRDPNEPLISSQELSWQAGHALYDANQDILTLSQEVQVTSPDGDQLTTATMQVQPGEKLDLPESFILKNDQMQLQGQSGSYWVNESRLDAAQGRLTLTHPGDDTVVVSADQLHYDRTTQVAEGTGNLTIEQPGLTIQAPQGHYSRLEAQSVLQGGVRLQEQRELGTVLAQATSSPPEQEVSITADQLQYDRTTQIAQGQGNLLIEQGETRISAPQGTYKRRDSQSILVGGVTLQETERTLTAARLNGNHRDKIFLFEENVLYRQQGDPDADGGSTSELRRSETEVTANQLLYNSATETAFFTGNVEFVQRGRKAKANEAVVSPEQIVLTGAVVLEQIQGDWLAQRSEDPDVQEALRQPTVIYAERVEIDQATNDARFWQDVVVVQVNRAAEGDQATYKESTQVLELAAEATPVLLCDRGDPEPGAAVVSVANLPGRDALDATCRGANRIRSKLITLDMEKNTFAAVGQSSMQFRVDEDSSL
ncbi:MAG: hypothetical protein OHK0012_00390 [Synechococcales cyanobacterium]